MAEISKITLPSGTTYDLKDTVARQMAQEGRISFVLCTNAANTPKDVTWDDGGTTITGTLVASSSTLKSFYLVPAVTQSGKDVFAEYITISDNDVYSWEKIGTTDIDLSSLGDLAYKDDATGSFTPAGTIVVNNSSGTGTAYTPEGSIAINSSGGPGTAYTPEGSVSAPTISVKTAGSTATIHNPTAATVATAVTAAAPGATAPSNAITYYSVSNETLSLYQLGYNTGNSITTSDVTVKTGDAVYQAAQPTFTGTEKKLQFSGSQKKLAFTGTAGTVTVS